MKPTIRELIAECEAIGRELAEWRPSDKPAAVAMGRRFAPCADGLGWTAAQAIVERACELRAEELRDVDQLVREVSRGVA